MTIPQAAVAAAERGWHVFPCRPGDKRPAVDRWEQRACSDPERVAAHWPEAANVGIACGPSGLVVIDLDCHGELPDDWRKIPGVHDGADVFSQLLEWAAQLWPSTYWTRTPSGGQHLYFTAPEGVEIRNSAGKLGPLVDVRGAGGYVVGAGSVVDGNPYVVIDDQDPVPLPGWLCRALTRKDEPLRPLPAAGEPGQRLAGLLRTVEEAPEGQRNQVLHWAACRAAELADDDGQVVEQLIAAAARAGLPETEARRTIASGMRGSR